MMNRIYFFTGTGNSLHVAKSIADALGDTELVAIHKGADLAVPQGLERVGFVFPVYGWGLPAMVAEFLRSAKLPTQGKTYYFAAATMGGLSGSSLPQVKRFLADKGVTLNYGGAVSCVKNSVTNYDMTKNPKPIIEKSDEATKKIIADVVSKKRIEMGRGIKLIDNMNVKFVAGLRAKAQKYIVGDNCVGCGICASVCPAKNIEMADGKPKFGAACEGCVACIQHCPKRAINIGKTADRRRYTHPNVGAKVIAEYYKEHVAKSQ
jgi:Pyruvate/2-oxoacid:ferredoxin oxidoreductase delta subunit